MGPTIEHFAGLLTLTMANAELIPYDIKRYPIDLRLHFNNATNKINKYHKDFVGFIKAEKEIENLFSISSKLGESIKNYLEQEKFSKKELKVLNQKLIALEKSFISEKGMYFGSWYKSLYSSSDPFSGYASWILPGLEYEIALMKKDRLLEWDLRYSKAINSLGIKMEELIKLLN